MENPSLLPRPAPLYKTGIRPITLTLSGEPVIEKETNLLQVDGLTEAGMGYVFLMWQFRAHLSDDGPVTLYQECTMR